MLLIDQYGILKILRNALKNKGDKLTQQGLAILEKEIIEIAKKKKDHDSRCHKALVKTFSAMTEPTQLIQIIDSIELEHRDLSLSSLAALAFAMSDRGELVSIEGSWVSLLS